MQTLMLSLILAFILLLNSSCRKTDESEPQLVFDRMLDIPKAFLTKGPDDIVFGGDIRIGDLSGNGQVDFLVYRSVDDAHDGGGMKPCFLGAFDKEGNILWQQGEGGLQPSRPGPVVIHDIDNDGDQEVICFFINPKVNCPPSSMQNVFLQIRDGKTGVIEKQATPKALLAAEGQGANWVHQRLLICNLRGTDSPRDFVVKLGKTIVAFDQDLNLLWSYSNSWDEYTKCPAYIPSHGQELRVADFDPQVPGPEMAIRYKGHKPAVMLVAVNGQVLRTFDLNDSPNHTGMEAIHWFGDSKRSLLYNGGVLWNGDGTIYSELPNLPAPSGTARRGWYHAIPVDLNGDAGEEIIVYNPWDSFIAIYSSTQLDSLKPYQPTARQYNVRLMD